MTQETKLRIHNITSESIIMYGSETWTLKQRDAQRLEAILMIFFEHLEESQVRATKKHRNQRNQKKSKQKI